MKTVRACKGQFEELIVGINQDKLFPCAPTPCHVGLLDGIVNLDIVTARLSNEYNEISMVFRSSWSKDLATLVAEVDRACPPWEPLRETLLDHPAMMQTMKDNESYGKIGRLSAEIRSYVKLVERLHLDRRGRKVMPLRFVFFVISILSRD